MTDIVDPPADTERESAGRWGDDDVIPDEGQSVSHPFRLLALIGLLVVIGVWQPLVLLVILAIVFMIFMHELGHYLTARSAGMKVTEFFIGFGPRIWSVRRGETEYGIKVLPAGAYVRIVGMNNLDAVAPADEDRTYRSKSYPRRISVAVAGSTMHFLMAIVLAYIGLVGFGRITADSERAWVVGNLPTAEELQEQYEGAPLSDDLQAMLDDGETPALAAGLEPGDRLLSANGQDLELFTDLRQVIRDNPGETVTLTVERGDETFETTLEVGEIGQGDQAIGVIGLGPEEPLERAGFVEAVPQSFARFGEITVASVEGIGRFFTPSGLSDFAGAVFESPDEADDPPPNPTGGGAATEDEDSGRIISIVGATRLGAEATESIGFIALINFMVLFNIFIGFFNLIPLPPFDGGHVALATYERFREVGRTGRYHADMARVLPIAYGVVVFIVTIGVMAIYADIANPVSLQ
jgi:membrane-associated protease RseP (regulator of RpoE activity)